MGKILRTLSIFSLLFICLQANAQITIGTVDAGPYTPGSSIAATFTTGATSCIKIGNIYNLYLSDASGSFTNEVLIGSYSGFYSTFVNGVIPNGTTAGTGYKVRIKSTNPAIVSTESAAFTIRAGTIVTAALNSASRIGTADPRTFGSCSSDESIPTTVFRFTNESSIGNVTATVTNEMETETPGTLTYTSINELKPFTAKLAHYTIFVKATLPDGSVGTKAYFLINNLAVTAFTTTGGITVCFPTGSFEYRVDVTSDNGIKANFPGDTYKIDWGDGDTDEYTYCDINTSGGRVAHSFSKSSCGLSYMSGTQTFYNAFGVNVGVTSPFCGMIGRPLSTPASVVTRPENNFNFPPIGCVGDAIVFSNVSTAGQKANTSSPNCTDNLVYYNWYIDDVLVQSDKTIDYSLINTFTTKGIHTIRLSSSSDGSCQAEDVTKTICIQDPPRPAFTLSANLLCLSSATITSNSSASVLDNTCPNTPVYTWAVSPATGVTFSPNSVNPGFSFSQTGVYNITLTIATGTCQVTTAPTEVVVNTTPVATLSPDISLCENGTYTFGPMATNTKTTISGTAKDLPDTYLWTVTGGNYSFVSPDGMNTKYPRIDFQEYKTYTVTLTHTNNCGTVTDTQNITFSPAPVPTITVTPTSVCYDAVVNLTGNIANPTPNQSFVWRSTGTGVFSAPNSLITTYTPSTAERNGGSTNISLVVNTGLVGDCAVVSANTSVIIYPNNTVTSSAALSACTGSAFTYIPTSTVAGSTFSWTAANADGNATGFSASGTGNISNTITNSSATANAIVIYTITPSANGCAGNPFTLTVTVTPRPVITAVAANPEICDNQSAAITLTSNLTGTRYSWTSVSSAATITGNTTVGTPAAITAINDILRNTGTQQGTVTYTITPYSESGCAGTAVIVVIKVDPAVTQANAGPDDQICNITSYTLSGNTPVVGTGLWTVTSGQTGVNFANPTSPTTNVTGLTGGQAYTFRWTISAAGACASSNDDVVITVNTPTVAGTTSGAASVCTGSNSGSITLAGNVGTVEGWESSTDGGVTWIAIVNVTTTLNYENLTATTRFRAVVKNGGCDIAYSNATIITVTPPTTVAQAGADQILCNSTTAILDANAVGQAGETGRWTIVTGTPNVLFTNAADPKTTVTGLVTGQPYVFRWTISGTSACGPSADDVMITNYPPLTNTISSTSTVVCYGQSVTVTGSVPTGGNGTYSYVWESSADGTTWTVITGNNTKDLTLILTGTLSFRRTVTSSICPLISNVIRIIAQPPITNNTILDNQQICNNTIPAPLTGSTPTGSDGNFNYQWQLSVDNGTSWTNITGATFSGYAPPALTATTLYRRVVSTITCNGALSNTSQSITITVKPDAKAEYTYTLDKGCLPFVIDANNIKAVLYPDRNATYTWFANNTEIGTGSTFPGYTIASSNESVDIRLVTTSSLGCTQDEFVHTFSTNQTVTASYTQSTTTGCGPLVVSFVNTSTSFTNATFKWDFGNGVTSTQVMPAAVTYLPDATGKDTTYTVTLTATTSCGANSFTSTVLVKAKPIAVFSPSRTTGCAPLKVTFSNTSPGGSNTYYYDFGDGTLLTKTDRADVEHTYYTTTVKDFVVKMIAENECGRDESSYTIRVSPNTVLPELVVNADEKEGCAPLKVNFYNNTKGANSFIYDFGDGSTVVTRTAPEVMIHTFTTPGTYTVTLRASNGCSDTTTTETITVLPQPLAAFTGDILLGCSGLTVQFKNTSTDGISYLWDFGDGTTSTEFEPSHVFNSDQEYYTVSLTATNTLGCTYTATRNQYIQIVTAPVAKFNVAPSTLISIPEYTFRFEDESTGNPTIWSWNFGDGITSNLQNPSHTYLDTGTYVVTLRVTNQQGCFTSTFKSVTIVGVPGYLYVPNSFIPGSDYPELREFKAKGSGMKTWKMSIFNKWGQTLWETTTLNEGRPVEGWNGMFQGIIQPQGVYFWKIDVEFINGSAWKGMTYDSSAPKKTGVIHLIR